MQKKHRKKKSASAVALTFLASIVVGVLVAVCYQTIFAKSKQQTQTLVVKKGDTYQSVLVAKPWQQSVFSSKLVARAYLKFAAKKPLQAGAYQIPAQASLAEAVNILQAGAKTRMITIRVIEGKTIKDLYTTLKTTDGVVLELLSPKQSAYTWQDVAVDNKQVAKALNISAKNNHLEGQFAPDTYYFNQGTSDKKILETLHMRQMKLIDEAWQGRDQNLPYDNKNELLIMASIIEKETGVPSERKQVSSVFVNRLNQGMKLQTDPTIIYGLFDRYDGSIYRSNINEKNDYNTYQMAGLPITPIALPSAAAIEAAAHPDSTPYLYFVATGTGGHTFTTNLADHNKAVAKYRAVVANQ